MTSSLDLARRDLQTVWHPCTQMKDHEWLPMIPIVRGEGVWLHDAVGHVELYREIYQPLLMDVVSVPTPDCYQREPGESWEAHSRRMFSHMEETLARHADTTCAVIVEPLVQCAGSLRMYHSSYLALVATARDGIEAATCD